jgi:transposase
VLPALTWKGYLAGTLIRQGSITAEVFEEWLEFTVLPQLEAGTILVLDNASIHRSARVKELVEAASCFLEYLPPYSPDFNPIEISFAWLKEWIKRHLEELDYFWNFEEFLRAGVEAMPGDFAEDWFNKCGYRK